MTAAFYNRLIEQNAYGPNLALLPMDIQPVWLCPHCWAEHDDEDDAIECCPTVVKAQYKCPICDDLHDSTEGAEACCGGCQSKQAPLQCPVCLKKHDSYDIAVDCCLPLHPAINMAGRERIVAALEQGASWLDAIAQNQNN